MMEELKKLPPLSPPEMVLPLKLKKKQPLVKKKTRNLIKVAQVASSIFILQVDLTKNRLHRNPKESRRESRS
jgi:hypothetical protein